MTVLSDVLDWLPARMAELEVAGVSVAVLTPEGTDAQAFGLADIADSTPMKTDTILQAGSVSKAVAALGALRLVDRGVIDLDVDVNEYLTSWKVPPVGDWQPRLTLRHLLTHTAGTTTHGFLGYAAGETVPSVPELLDGAGNSDAVRVNLLPGTKWRYSGGGSTIAQQVLVDVTGRPYTELMHELIFEPLGLSNAGFMHPLPEDRWPSAARGHHSASVPVEGGWHTHPELAAAGLWCTPSQLCAIASAVQDALHGVPGSLVSQETIREATTGLAIAPHMGIGFFTMPAGRFGHDGANIGYLTGWVADCDERYALATMTNSFNGMPVLREITLAILEAYPWPERPTPVPPDMQALLIGLLGDWVGPGGLTLSVAAQGNDLAISVGNQAPVLVDPCMGGSGMDLRELALRGIDARIVLGDGKLLLRQPGEDLEFVR